MRKRRIWLSEGSRAHGGLLQREFRTFKDAKSMALNGEIVKALIFQSETKKHVAGSEPKKEGKKKGGRGKHAQGEQHGQETKSKKPRQLFQEADAHLNLTLAPALPLLPRVPGLEMPS